MALSTNKTLFRNPNATQKQYSFLGRYGMTLYGQQDKSTADGKSDTWEVDGDIFAQGYTARYDNNVRMDALIEAINNGDIEVISSSQPTYYDAAANASKIITINNGIVAAKNIRLAKPNVTSISGGSASFTVSYSAVTDATDYEVEYAKKTTFNYPLAQAKTSVIATTIYETVKTLSTKDANVSYSAGTLTVSSVPAGSYYVRVRAKYIPTAASTDLTKYEPTVSTWTDFPTTPCTVTS